MWEKVFNMWKLFFSHLLSHPPDAKYPDAIALAYDESNGKLTCVYNDHSLYVWDVNDIRRVSCSGSFLGGELVRRDFDGILWFFFQVGKSHSFLYHSACIWGVEMYPDVETHEPLPVPAGSFITCSSDDTIRVWNLNPMSNNNATIYRRNIYSNVSNFMCRIYFDEKKKLRRILAVCKKLTIVKIKIKLGGFLQGNFFEGEINFNIRKYCSEKGYSYNIFKNVIHRFWNSQLRLSKKKIIKKCLGCEKFN